MSALYKTILSGCLEFGNQRSYDQVLKFYQHRTENYYRNDILLKAEEVFQPNTYILTISRFIKECAEKTWKNTLNLLEFVAEYAIAGDIRVWIVHNGKLIEQRIIEPVGDKTAIHAFKEGRQLVKQKGMEQAAIKALNQAIEKFERHALAYERRGVINFKLQNYEDAMYDFSKSIDINPNNPEPYWGRAHTRLKKGDKTGAIQDLEMAIAKSIPHQPIFWSARRLKGELCYLTGQFQSALAELKMVANRAFTEDDPNYKWQRNVLFYYGRALTDTHQYAEAVAVFNKMFTSTIQSEDSPSMAIQYFYRGVARHKAGDPGWKSDLDEAEKLGCPEATAYLKGVVISV